jgi:hypothetical protein
MTMPPHRDPSQWDPHPGSPAPDRGHSGLPVLFVLVPSAVLLIVVAVWIVVAYTHG